MTIQQLDKASAELRRLAAGQIDGYGYDHDAVSRGFGVGFTSALTWAQEQHQ